MNPIEYLQEHWVFAIFSLGISVVTCWLVELPTLSRFFLMRPRLCTLLAVVLGFSVWAVSNVVFAHTTGGWVVCFWIIAIVSDILAVLGFLLFRILVGPEAY